MKHLAFLGFLTVAACGGQQSPTIVTGLSSGVAVLRKASASDDDKLSVSDLVERHGTFDLRGRCLVLWSGGTDYSPVFSSNAVEQAAVTDVLTRKAGEHPVDWELFGGPLSREEAKTAATNGCGKTLFMLTGAHPSEPHLNTSSPPRPPKAP